MVLHPELEKRVQTLQQECGSKVRVFRDGVNTLYCLLYQLPAGSKLCYKMPDGKVTELMIMYAGGAIEPKGNKP